MDGRSVTALTTLCSTISQRTISCANEVRVLVEALDPRQHGVSPLTSLASALEELNQQATQLEESLNSSTISMQTHDSFIELLIKCDGTITVLYKQLLRLQPDNVGRVNVEFLVAYFRTIMANSNLLKSMDGIAKGENRDQQETSPSLASLNDVISQVEQASEVSSAQISVLLELSESLSVASGSNSASTAQEESENAEPPPYSAEVDSAPSSSSAQPPKLSWGASLRNSFKALALSMVPQPGPFVSALCQAAAIGDTQQIAGFLSQGANINGRNEKGKNALQCAIMADQEDSVRLLLASGASTSGSGWSGIPPLFLAASQGSLKTAKLFMDRGASINEKNISGQAYFVDVVQSDNIDGIRFLLEQGCSPNTKSISGEAVIAHVVRKKNMALVELFFEFGVNIKSKDISGQTLLAVALNKKDYEMAELLLKKGADPNGKTISGMPLLADEIGNRRLKTAKLLLDWNADPNTKDWHSNPVLILAVKSKISPEEKIDIIRHLFSKGAKANVVDGFSKAPAIRFAVETGISEIITLMLRNGAKTTEKMPNGDSLLKYAIDQGKRDLVETLLHYGADPNQSAESNGVRPLVQVLMKQDFDMIRLLLEAGADANAIEVQDVARALGKSDIYEVLGMEEPREAPVPPPIEGDPPNYDAAMKN